MYESVYKRILIRHHVHTQHMYIICIWVELLNTVYLHIHLYTCTPHIYIYTVYKCLDQAMGHPMTCVCVCVCVCVRAHQTGFIVAHSPFLSGSM